MFACDDLDIDSNQDQDSDSDSNSLKQDQKLIEANYDVIRSDTPNFLRSDDLSNQKKDGHKYVFRRDCDLLNIFFLGFGFQLRLMWPLQTLVGLLRWNVWSSNNISIKS